MRKPLRVLLLNERCHRNPLAGGAELHLFEIAERMAARGVETELLCCGFDGAEPVDTHRGVAISRVGTRLSYYARVTAEVRKRLAAGTVDVIVEAHNKIPFFTPLYAGDVPTVVIHHHLHGLAAFHQVNPLLASASVALERMIPLVYRRVPFLTISASSKVDLVRRGIPEEHVDVVPCGVDQVHQPGRLEGRAPRVVSLGRLEPYKRLDLLIRAMRRVVDDVPAAHLDIVGRGQDEARLRKLTASLDFDAHVTFHGFVTEADKVALLQDAALLVQCSKKEGWGLTVTEAYACGTPVVATAVPGLIDSVQDGVTGLLVRHAKPAPLACAIADLLCDEPKRVRLARRALHWASGLSWTDAAQHIHGALTRAHRGEVPWRHARRELAAPPLTTLPAWPPGVRQTTETLR